MKANDGMVIYNAMVWMVYGKMMNVYAAPCSSCFCLAAHFLPRMRIIMMLVVHNSKAPPQTVYRIPDPSARSRSEETKDPTPAMIYRTKLLHAIIEEEKYINKTPLWDNGHWTYPWQRRFVCGSSLPSTQTTWHWAPSIRDPLKIVKQLKNEVEVDKKVNPLTKKETHQANRVMNIVTDAPAIDNQCSKLCQDTSIEQPATKSHFRICMLIFGFGYASIVHFVWESAAH